MGNDLPGRNWQEEGAEFVVVGERECGESEDGEGNDRGRGECGRLKRARRRGSGERVEKGECEERVEEGVGERAIGRGASAREGAEQTRVKERDIFVI